MSKKIGLLFCVVLPCFLAAQAPDPAPSKPDSAEVKAHIEKARTIAGAQWATAVNFFCIAPRANSSTDPLIEPAKILDNVYVMGRQETVVYAITTSDGIILIDSGYPDQAESILLPHMKKLGLDPAKVKYVIVTHGHGDHAGGSGYMQEHYGAKVVLSAADWDFMEPKPGEKKGKAQANQPRRDVVAVEGQPITLGDEQVTPVFTPGHTPGSMGVIFNVKEGGQTHMAGLFGGTILLPGRPPVETLQQYLQSVEHYSEIAKRMKVDVELQNHPIMDDILVKLAKLQERKPGQPNPFVVGQEGYGKYVDVMAECMRAQIARRAE